MIVSKLTAKSQTTIPQSVRRALQLKPGDELVYEIIEQRVILTRARPARQADDPFRAFDEWTSAADDDAYADL
jgi:antitoxin PrlF